MNVIVMLLGTTVVENAVTLATFGERDLIHSVWLTISDSCTRGG